MRFARDTLINAVSGATNITSSLLDSNQLLSISAQAIATGTLAGTLKLQWSDDVGFPSSTAPTNWTDLASVAVTAAGLFSIPKTDLCYRWLRATYTATSGTGNMSASNLFPIYFIDPPNILNASVTSIPGSASLPLQVVAESGNRAAYQIDYIDTTGDYIGVYTGEVASEVLRCIIGGGLVSSSAVVIAAHSRVSLRSMTATAITNGKLTITFMGQGLR